MINKRLKRSEKSWSEHGAEAILRLRADYLIETEPMSRFWLEPEASASIHRPYRRLASTMVSSNYVVRPPKGDKTKSA